MTTIYTFYKNSNTGQLIIKQSFKDTNILFPDNFYTHNRKKLESNFDLKGFVQVSIKKFEREAKKQNKQK